MEKDPNQPDPMLGPKVPFNPEEYGYFPDVNEEDRSFIEETQGDLTLLLLMTSAQTLRRLQAAGQAFSDTDQRLRSFEDRIQLRKLFLEGEA